MGSQFNVSGSENLSQPDQGVFKSQESAANSFADELAEVRKEKEYFASVIKNFRNGMLTTDNDLNIVFSNLTVERLLGFTAEELKSIKLYDLIQTKETTVKKILEQGGRCVDPKTGEMGEFSFITKSGDVFPVEACFSVIPDVDGAVCGMSCTFRDVTQKKKMERTLARMDRLASLGELASGMAHEIKNPLACIAGVMQNLNCSNVDESCAEMVPEILFQVKRIDTIINGLLRFAKPSPTEMRLLHLAGIIRDTTLLVESSLKENDIELQLDLGESDPLVKGDEFLLQQVFLNVVMNACEALAQVDDKRTLKVTLTYQESREPGYDGERPDIFEYVEVDIVDNGLGIDTAFLDSIFNPFFTTKYSGTGLGLATSHRIMEEHDGAISVISSPGKGAAFKLSLPVYTHE